MQMGLTEAINLITSSTNETASSLADADSTLNKGTYTLSKADTTTSRTTTGSSKVASSPREVHTTNSEVASSPGGVKTTSSKGTPNPSKTKDRIRMREVNSNEVSLRKLLKASSSKCRSQPQDSKCRARTPKTSWKACVQPSSTRTSTRIACHIRRSSGMRANASRSK